MIKEMYISNYKGFEKKIIKFKQCNFFVGENNAGKTALISLIRNLSKTQTCSFSNTEWRNTAFKSLITKGKASVEKAVYVTLQLENEKKEQYYKFYKIVNINDYPFIKRISISLPDSNNVLHVKHNPKTIDYATDKKAVFSDVESFFNYCRNDHQYMRQKDIFEDQERVLLPIYLLFENELVQDNFNHFFRVANNVKYISPIRYIPEGYESKIKKEYDPTGKDLLQRFISLTKKNNKISEKINNFGERSGLFQKFSVNKYKTDMPIIPMSATITKNNVELPLNFIGTGVSQVMPIILDLYDDDEMLLISQPELHLHPKAQFELGKEIFYSLLRNKDRQIFIETHSDFLIDSIREEQFLSNLINSYLKQANEKSKHIKNNRDMNRLYNSLNNYLTDTYNFSVHNSLKNTIDYNIMAYNQDFISEEYLVIQYFEREKSLTKVYPIEISVDGKFRGDFIQKYRNFYLEYASRGLYL